MKTTLKATLTESDLRRADGGYSTGTCNFHVSNNTAWSSSYPASKCDTNA